MKTKLLTLLLIYISVASIGCGAPNTISTNNVSTEGTLSAENAPSIERNSALTNSVPTATNNLSISFEQVPYDNSSLESILSGIQADFTNTIEKLLTRLGETNATIGTTYEDYKKNKQLLTDWYNLAIFEEAALFARTEERALEYYRLMVTSIDHEDGNALDDAIDNFYDTVYSDAMDDFYDEIYDDAMDDVYDTYYDGIVDDGYDYDPYQKWSEESSECYEAWSETSSAIYKAWSAASSTLYRQYCAISSGLYQGNYDIDSIWEEYQKKITQEEAASDIEAVAGIRPEFQEAMDSYEAFFDEYISFIQIYKDSAPEDTLLMLDEYADYMEQYAKTMESFSNLRAEEMTTEEALYYAEVSSRITAKLLEVQ